MLDRYSVVDEVRNRRYLLEKTQHLVGGFGKAPGDPPGKVIAC
jgi:geranylgeranyl transferase type-1 subunit beta